MDFTAFFERAQESLLTSRNNRLGDQDMHGPALSASNPISQLTGSDMVDADNHHRHTDNQSTMSGRQTGVLDPQLASGLPAPQYGQLPRPPPPPPYAHGNRDSLKSEVPPPHNAYSGSSHQSPQPYYHYPTPQTHTPQQHGNASTGSQSNQPSPNEASFPPHGLPMNESSPGQGDGDDGQNGDDPKRPRAWEACRGLKVRCDQDPAHPEIPCKRCAKAGRQCVITQPSRKRQKKADSRVAELEKKLDALTAVLHQQQGAPGSSGGQYDAQAQQGAPPAQMMQNRMRTDSMPSYQSPSQYPQPGAGASRPGSYASNNKRRRTNDDNTETPTLDGADETVADRYPRGNTRPARDSPNEPAQALQNLTNSWGPDTDLKRFLHHTTPEEFVNRVNSLIPPDMASAIFNRYITQLSPHLPAVVFPPGTTADQVFREKPILYVCILSAASFGQIHPDTSKKIGREAVGAIADCVVRNGAKSLELIQAMQVTALWYKPPEQAEQTNFYQIIHMAAVMALDIGLGKRFNAAKARRGFLSGRGGDLAPGPGPRSLPQDSDTLEARRAWLGCYYLCAR